MEDSGKLSDSMQTLHDAHLDHIRGVADGFRRELDGQQEEINRLRTRREEQERRIMKIETELSVERGKREVEERRQARFANLMITAVGGMGATIGVTLLTIIMKSQGAE